MNEDRWARYDERMNRIIGQLGRYAQIHVRQAAEEARIAMERRFMELTLPPMGFEFIGADYGEPDGCSLVFYNCKAVQCRAD